MIIEHKGSAYKITETGAHTMYQAEGGEVIGGVFVNACGDVEVTPILSGNALRMWVEQGRETHESDQDYHGDMIISFLAGRKSAMAAS